MKIFLTEERSIPTEMIFKLLSDKNTPNDDALPDKGLKLEKERKLVSVFAQGGQYGTRSSIVITIDIHGKVYFEERNFDEDANLTKKQQYQFQITD